MSAPQPIQIANAAAVTHSLRPLQNPLAAWRELEGEVVIMSPEDSVLHELNETASFIWKQATGERNIEGIARAMSAEFAVDETTALEDTRALVEELRSKGLLLIEPAAQAATGASHG
jgi:hypothetical protein